MMTAIALAQVATGARRGRVGVLDAAARMADEAAGRGASLICFPEQFVTGWSPDVPPVAGEPLDGPLATAFGHIAERCGIAVAGSIIESSVGCRPKNTVVVTGADAKLLAAYAKIHLFSPDGEDLAYEAGDRIATLPLMVRSLGLLSATTCGSRNSFGSMLLRGRSVSWCPRHGRAQGSHTGRPSSPPELLRTVTTLPGSTRPACRAAPAAVDRLPPTLTAS